MTSEYMMRTFLGFAHSGWRWVVILTALVAFAWAFIRLVRGTDNPRLTRFSMLAFTIGMDMQVLFGILHFLERLSQDAIYDGIWIHLVLGLVALGVLHGLTARARRQTGQAQARTHLIAVVASFALVFVGVASLIGGLPRWL
jgi:FtsH-binding integral membrane protein